MERKLIQLSPSTAVVSLPSSWVKRNRLGKGTALNVEETENRIVISAQRSKTDKEITVDISKLDKKLMWLAIDAAYIAGYDTITILTRDHEQTEYMTTVVRYFLGMIIEEEHKRSVTFKDMADTALDIDKILSRIFNLNIALLEDAIEASKARDWKLLLDIKRRDYTINSYVSLCLRHINKTGYTPFSKTGAMHSYLRLLEMYSDKMCALCVALGKAKADAKPLVKLLELYRGVQKLHFSFSQAQLLQLDAERRKCHDGLPKNAPVALIELLELLVDIEEAELILHT